MSEPRLFVRIRADTDACRHCFLPEREHKGRYQPCPITGQATIEYAASVGAEWAARIMEQTG